MKKYLVLSLLVIGIMFVVSCTNDNEKPVDSQPATNANKTLIELQEYNSQFISEHSVTRANWWNYIRVASADYKWGKRGAKAGQIIAGIAGVATGGSGYAITVGVSAGVAGGYASYRKWQQLYSDDEGASVSYQEAMNRMEGLYANNYYNNTLNSLGVDNYAVLGAQINLPSNYEHLRRIGNDHNMVLEQLREESVPFLSRGPFEEGHITESILTTPIEDLFDEYELQYTSSSAFSAITTSSDGDSAASVSFTVDSIVDTFDTLLHSVSMDNAGLVSAINSYISIIENNNELTYSEKEDVYSTLIIALYSILYWNDNL